MQKMGISLVDRFFGSPAVLLAHLNLCSTSFAQIFEVPANGAIGGGHNGDPGGLVFNLRVEQFTKVPSDGQVTEYQTVVPVLDRPPKNVRAHIDRYANKGWSKKYREDEMGHVEGERSHIRIGNKVIDLGEVPEASAVARVPRDS